MIGQVAPTGERPSGSTIRELLRHDGPAALIGAAATVAIQLGLYLIVRLQGVAPAPAVLATLAVSTVWVALAGPILAAGAAGRLGGLFRAGAVADATALTLIVLWIFARNDQSEPLVPLLAAAEIYCTLASLAVAGAAIVGCGRSEAARRSLSVATAVAFMVALAGPFWIGGMLGACGAQARESLAVAAVCANPFYSVAAAVAETTGFTWQLSPVMYGITRIGDYTAAPDTPWYAATVVYSCVAGVALGVDLLRRRGPCARTLFN